MTSMSKSKRSKVLAKTDGHCAYCGLKLSLVSAWNIDHAIPQAQGGSRDLSNLFPSCRSCSSRKRGRTVREFNDVLRDRARAALGTLDLATTGWGPAVMKMKWAPGCMRQIEDALSNLSLAIDNSDTQFFADDLFCEAGLRDKPRTFKFPSWLAIIKEDDDDY